MNRYRRRQAARGRDTSLKDRHRVVDGDVTRLCGGGVVAAAIQIQSTTHTAEANHSRMALQPCNLNPKAAIKVIKQ